MAADGFPDLAACYIANQGPAQRYADRGAFAQRIVHARQSLESEHRVAHARVDNAGGARGGAFGDVQPVRVEFKLQVFCFRLARELREVTQFRYGQARPAADVRRPSGVVQKIVVRIDEELMRPKVSDPLVRGIVAAPFRVFVPEYRVHPPAD